MEEYKEKLETLKVKLNINEKRAELLDLKEQSSNEAVWSDWQTGQKIMQDIKILEKEIEDFDLLELYLLENDTENFEKELKHIEIKTYLSGKYDEGSALLTLHAGQGGTEACDWASMLLRMYLRYAEKKGYKVEEIEKISGDEAGIKTTTYEISGAYAYGFLKNEAGVHRLIRLSPFNANNLRQTSFALVEIMPVINDDIEIDIKPEDLEFDAHRSSGSGGQNVNKVSTAVRLRHIPTGIVVDCQTERFQGRNRELAMKILRGKLFALKQQEIDAEKKAVKGEHKNAGWGNQIRNYVLHPYKLVKDTRTNYESTNPEAVLDGNLDEFIEAELRI